MLHCVLSEQPPTAHRSHRSTLSQVTGEQPARPGVNHLMGDARPPQPCPRALGTKAATPTLPFPGNHWSAFGHCKSVYVFWNFLRMESYSELRGGAINPTALRFIHVVCVLFHCQIVCRGMEVPHGLSNFNGLKSVFSLLLLGIKMWPAVVDQCEWTCFHFS